MSNTLLSVKGLKVQYQLAKRNLNAINSLDFDLAKGEILGVAGESGCGKSTLGLALMRLLPEVGKIVGGTVQFAGHDLLSLTEKEMDGKIRGAQMSMIFQNPQNALNPVFTIKSQMVDMIMAQRDQQNLPALSRKEMEEEAINKLRETGVADPETRIDNYPFEFSGGMKQRVVIAMALSSETSLLIADEPTTALDVTIEAQINGLILEMAEKFNTSVLYVSHDLAVLSQMCDRIIIMYAGSLVEEGRTEDVFSHPAHPYTAALLASLPGNAKKGEPLLSLDGHVPALDALPAGCAFHPRCKFAQQICETTIPSHVTHENGQKAACHFSTENNTWQW